tara:strand:- start:2882 stop:3682 length:801 start_codon:yes stop_codon:yes gene_type:complete
MKLGVVGVGVVGGAIAEGFKDLGHDVYLHDIKYNNTSIENVLPTKICFICVPTPPLKDGECDTSIVLSVIEDLQKLKYQGIIAIKSTVSPGTTEKMQKKFAQLEICFVPEFLRERCAISDFTENHDICVVGTNKDWVYSAVKESHGDYPNKFIKLTPTEAEITKYFNNVYNATLIIFANSFYEVCKSLGVDYKNVKDAVTQRNHISKNYLECNNNLRGFGGVCLPKDTLAMAKLSKKLGINIEFFEMLLRENKKYKTTVYDGMREQ